MINYFLKSRWVSHSIFNNSILHSKASASFPSSSTYTMRHSNSFFSSLLYRQSFFFVFFFFFSFEKLLPASPVSRVKHTNILCVKIRIKILLNWNKRKMITQIGSSPTTICSYEVEKKEPTEKTSLKSSGKCWKSIRSESQSNPNTSPLFILLLSLLQFFFSIYFSFPLRQLVALTKRIT